MEKVRNGTLRFIENVLKCGTATCATWRQRTLYDNNTKYFTSTNSFIIYNVLSTLIMEQYDEFVKYDFTSNEIYI
jgi:hypothetical protein